jgi:hypothetical protein
MSIESKAREYVLMNSKLKYDNILAHAASNYVNEADQKAFVNAVLHAGIVISNEKSREADAEKNHIVRHKIE